MGPIQIGSEVKNGPDLNGLFPWNQVHEKYECGHSWWGTNCDTSMLLYQSSTFSMRKVMQNRILVGGWKGKKKRVEKRYHSIVKIVFVAATHNCMYINRVGRHVDHPTKTNDQTNKSKFFRGFIVEILIIHTQYR